jgi:RNA polymerase sigma-70 factor (ECF subfamily)
MNRAIAIGYHESPLSGINALKNIRGLENNHLYHAALGDFYLRAGDKRNALLCYDEAILHTKSITDRELIARKKLGVLTDSE